MPNKLTFCSFNIEGLLKKLDDPSFIDFVNRFDVISLQETFMSENVIPKDVFDNFLTHYFSPATKLSAHGRCSGGVTVLVKKYLVDYIQEVNTECPNCVILKLQDLFSKDVLCIFPYIPCSTSPYYNGFENRNGIIILESFLTIIINENPNCSLIILGDLNSRTADVQPIYDCNIAAKYTDDLNSDAFFHDDCKFTRNSLDKTLNQFGKSLIEMCASLSLIILNGYCLGDTDGAFTFISPNGSSVIDYCIVSDDFLCNSLSLNVESRIESWHMPLVLDVEFLARPLTQINSYSQTLSSSYFRYKWLDVKKPDFLSNWSSSDCFVNISNLNEIVLNNADLVTDCVTAFTDMLVNASHMMMKKVVVDINSVPRKNSWFDRDCLTKKRSVRNALRKFFRSRLLNDKLNYISLRSDYKNCIRRKKRIFSESKSQYLLDNVNNSSLFWKEIRNICPKKITRCNINLSKWYEHFKSIFDVRHNKPPICFEPPLSMSIIDDDSRVPLNSKITVNEVSRAIFKCKPNKSCGPDNLLNEVLKYTHDDTLIFIVNTFNILFENKIFPLEWAHANIIPIYKKGDVNLCDNYRPIWLTSLFSKLYTNILNTRINEFTTLNNVIPEEQAGFRSNYSTIDHIFTLYAMISLQFYKNKKLYVCFVDYRKAFDSVQREALFKILEARGFDGNFLSAIKSIYNKVNASIYVDGCHSETFTCPVGLKQGCLLSPNLFSLFMTEISLEINKRGLDGIAFMNNFDTIFHLLFADDIILVSDSVIGLQNQINVLESQSIRLGLTINENKTQIVIFRKGGYVARREKWYYGNKCLKIVNAYRYLGIDFTTKLSFNNATRPFVSKAKQICFELSKSLYNIDCYSLDVFSKLFDAKVLPVLTYACELWGMDEMLEIERVHTVSFKRFLNVSTHCANLTLYADTGRLPLSINIKVRCVKYWFRILKMEDKRICKQAYEKLFLLCEQGSTNWVSKIKRLLEYNGFGIVWFFNGVGNEPQFLSELRQRLIDSYKQGWHAHISESENFSTFYSFKPFIKLENFLCVSSFGRSLRNVLIRFRLGVSAINQHRYKFYSNKNLLKCPACNAPVENEFHVLFECVAYNDLRHKLPIKIVNNKTTQAMLQLLSNDEHNISVSKFLVEMFARRYDYVN